MREASRASAADRSAAPPCSPGSGDGLALHEGPQRDLLLPGQPAQLPGVAAELGTAALDQGEHLQHAVVHGPRQPGPLGHRRRRSARPAARASVASRIRPVE